MTKSYERTLVLIKPDVHKAGLSLAVEAAYRKAGLRDVMIRTLTLQKVPNLSGLIEAHYAEHNGREYYDKLVDFMTSGPITAIIFEGDNVIERVRKLNGATDPSFAEEGTIRQRFGTNKTLNAVHASDSVKSAEREIAIWFPHAAREAK